MKPCTRTIRLLVYCTILTGLLTLANAQSAGPITGPTIQAQSSEWEATAFNNGRRMVRDANGYFHAFWHSRDPLPAGPMGSGAHIFYSHTTLPAAEPPSMAIQGAWRDPVNLTLELAVFKDHRYPSVAIEYDIYDGQWKNINTLHVTWQALASGLEGPGSDRYEVLYASVPVMNPPNYLGGPWFAAQNLSTTPETDSLVPTIAINQHGGWANQHIHVVWQEEDINNGGDPNLVGDALFSDIAYIRSVDSGLSWLGPAGGWIPYRWDNISQTATNSQMPSVSCILDQFTGAPAQTNRQELGYNTNTVHVAYHEDVFVEEPLPQEIHVFYTKSPDDGFSWQPRTDVTLALNLLESDKTEAYPSLAVDMLDHPHLAYMINNLAPAEPLREGGPSNDYLAGIHPQQNRAFPGPNPGMYGTLSNDVVAAYHDGNSWQGVVLGARDDNEFPTIALERYMHENVNYQGWSVMPEPTGDYEIIRHERLNSNTPSWPMLMPVYGMWNSWINDSMDAANDDLFPNMAHKRVAVYKSPVEPSMAGYDEVWTKVVGHGPDQATSNMQMRQIWQDGNMGWLDPDPSPLYVYGADALPMNHDDPPSQSAGTDFGRVALNQSAGSGLSLVNPGPHPITISGLSTNGPNAGEFGAACPVALPANSTNLLALAYDPVTAGAATADVSFKSNSRTPFYRLNLAGAGAYTLVGQKSGAGTITPEGLLLMLPGESTNFVIQANADHYIGVCETNSQSVAGVAGLDTYTVYWNTIAHTGLTYASFLNVTNNTATNNTPVKWLREHYTNAVDLAALMAYAEQDSDGDGAVGWKEYRMDTDPTNKASVLVFSAVSNLPPLTVFFDSSSNRTYTLLVTECLTNACWTNVPGGGPRAGIGAADSMSCTNAPATGFYRIKVDL